jgi:hypothetical protein
MSLLYWSDFSGSLHYYIKKAFMGSFSYDRSREIFAPLAHHHEDNNKKLEDFYLKRGEEEKLEREKVIDKVVVVGDGINQAKSKQVSYVERLGTDSGLGKISR